MTSRVRNPGPDLEHANQRGEAKPYNGIAAIPMNAINMSLYVYFQRLLFIVIQLLTSCVVLLIAFKLMCITECVISCVENGTFWIICFSKKYKLYRVV